MSDEQVDERLQRTEALLGAAQAYVDACVVALNAARLNNARDLFDFFHPILEAVPRGFAHAAHVLDRPASAVGALCKLAGEVVRST